MDYIIDELFGKGFKPETRREANFVDELKNDGFVFFEMDNLIVIQSYLHAI